MVKRGKKTGYSKSKSKILLSNSENGEPLSPQDAAEKINEYFVNLTEDYRKIEEHHLVVSSDFELPTVPRNSVCKKFYEINIYKSPMVPLIHHQRLLRFAEEFSIPLTDIINSSFLEKRFGDIWKAYNLTAIPKCNPCTVIENLRPIAIISIFSKIQESYALEWMLQDLKDNINRRQFGEIS